MRDTLRRTVCLGLGTALALAPLSRAEAVVIGTSSIANGAVTTPKLGNLAVTNAKIGNAAVTNAKIGTYAITHTKIANGNVINSKIAAGAVTGDKIAPNAVTPDKVAFYSRVIVVAPSGGDFTSPVEAMNSINDASQTNPYLVRIMPGYYHIGESTVWMKPYVDIEGSGQLVTTIGGTVHTADANGFRPGVVQGNSQCELRDLSVENSGAVGDHATAVAAVKAANCSNMRITRVGARATGSDINVGILVALRAPDENAFEIDPVVITESDGSAGGSGSYMGAGIMVAAEEATPGVRANTADVLAAILLNSTAGAYGATNGNAAFKIKNATAIILGGGASAGDAPASNLEYAFASDGGGGLVQGALLMSNISVKNNSARAVPLTLTGCNAVGSTIVSVDSGSLAVKNSSLDGEVSMLSTASTPALTLQNSGVSGAVAAGDGTFTAVISSVGGAVTGTGSLQCAGAVRSDTLAPLSATCQ